MIATGERMDVRNPLEWWLLAVGVWGVVTVAFSVAELWAFRRDSWVKWARLAALALVGGVFCVVGGLGLVLVLGPSLGMILNMVFSLIG
jgi:uncharacterized membrane protein